MMQPRAYALGPAADPALRRIVWAVDPFEQNKRMHRAAAHFLRGFAGRTGALIHPVFVLSASQLDIYGEFGQIRPLADFRAAAQKNLAQLLSGYFLPKLQKPYVVVQESVSLSESTDLLTEYAESINGSMIVVSTHARSGMRRILLGSFAETLITRSNIPVVAIRPEKKPPPSMNEILFPTDFGSNSRFVFRKVVHLARALGSKVILFHSVLHPVEPIFQSGISLLGGSWIPIQAYFGGEVDFQRRRADAWARWAGHQGVRCDAVVHNSGGSVAELITLLAKRRRVGMIAMETRSGPIAAALIGSVTRQVVRNSNCPVWVCRYDRQETSTQDLVPVLRKKLEPPTAA